MERAEVTTTAQSESALVFTVAPANLFRTAAGTLAYAGQAVYLPRAEGASFVVAGVLLPPPGLQFQPGEKSRAAWTAFERLEREGQQHGAKTWLSRGHIRRQYERIHAALKEGAQS